MRITKTLLLSGNKEALDKGDILALNRDLENIFIVLRRLQSKKYEITGSKGGNAALESLLDALADADIITDSTT